MTGCSPSQDMLPSGEVGNLIAAPRQGKARRDGTTVFVDPSNLESHEDSRHPRRAGRTDPGAAHYP